MIQSEAVKSKTLFILFGIILFIRIVLAYCYEAFYASPNAELIKDFINSCFFWIISLISGFLFYKHLNHRFQKRFAFSLILLLMLFETMYVAHNISLLFCTDFIKPFLIIYLPLLFIILFKTIQKCLQNLRQEIGWHSLHY